MRRLTRRQQIGAVVLAAVALLFISLDFAGGSLAEARGGATGALGSLYRGTDALIGPVRRFIQGIPNVGDNRREIAKLNAENQQLRRQLSAAQLDADTAAQLKALQLQADSAGWRVLPARVVATGPGAGFQWTVTVDAGSQDHVVVGQTVTDGYGLVGRVIAVHGTTSVILLTADPSFGVGARDARSGDLLLVTGAGTAQLSGSPLDNRAAIKAGDRLITGPAGKTTFVSGIEIGTVAAVHTGGDGTVTISIRPTVRLTALNLLSIVQSTSPTTTRQTTGGAGQ